MKNVAVIGAGGQIARHVISALSQDATVTQTLFLREPKKLDRRILGNARVVMGDVLNPGALSLALQDQDIVYVNLAGDNLDMQAAAVIEGMQKLNIKRLVFVLSLGIYDEVPGNYGEWNNAIIGESLEPYRRAAALIGTSGLDYTILRPAWLDDVDEVDYETTSRDELFKGTVVSRKSVADVIVKIINDPTLYSMGDIGINKPGTDGDKPYFM